jgi:probable phosphoglycerate mutase
MELLLIRHGLPVRFDDVGVIADPPLAPGGIEAARLLAEHLAAEPPDAVWTSPQRRALETASIVAARLGLDMRQHDGLAESDRGSTSYVPMEELRAADDPRWRALVGRLRAGDACSDSELAFRASVTGAMEDIIAAHPGQRAVVVCHAGVINAYVGGLLGVPRPLWFEPAYASISRVLASRRGERGVGSLNETGHLRRPSAGA